MTGQKNDVRCHMKLIMIVSFSILVVFHVHTVICITKAGQDIDYSKHLELIFSSKLPNALYLNWHLSIYKVFEGLGKKWFELRS